MDLAASSDLAPAQGRLITLSSAAASLIRMVRDVQREVARRDSAFARVRSVTAIAVFASAGLTAALTAVADASTHLRKTVVRTHTVTHERAVTAPTAPLVPVRTAEPATQAPPPTPAPAPVPSASSPVAVSGGS